MRSGELRVRRLARISGEIEVPGDKSISHRAAIIAGLSDGPCRISNYLASEDCLNTLRAMERLGVQCDGDVSGDVEGAARELVVHGCGGELEPAGGSIDCGNSGTGMRLLTGVLAAQPFSSILAGDASLSKRPMNRVIRPLAQMGARIEAQGEREGCAPLKIIGTRLQGTRYKLPVASAQVKSAILLAGVFAKGKTTVVQPVATRDHTERMLAKFRVRTVRDGDEISVYGGQRLRAADIEVPGDLSSAAFWIVAAAANPKSKLLVKNVGLNPTRTAILPVLLRMGAKIKDRALTPEDAGEPAGHIVVEGAALRGTGIRPDEVPNLIDEIPVLAVAGALAQGRMVIRQAAELRVKETDRIAAVCENLREMGAEVEEFEDGLEIEGGRRLRGAVLDSYGDHRIAMAFAVAGLFAEGETVITGTDCIATSYPGFEAQLREIRGRAGR